MDTHKLFELYSLIILFRLFRRSTRVAFPLSMVALGTVSARTLLPWESGMFHISLKAVRISSPSMLNAMSLWRPVRRSYANVKFLVRDLVLLRCTQHNGPVEWFLALSD